MSQVLKTILDDLAHLRDKQLAALLGGAVAALAVSFLPGVNLSGDAVAGGLVLLGGVATVIEGRANLKK